MAKVSNSKKKDPSSNKITTPRLVSSTFAITIFFYLTSSASILSRLRCRPYQTPFLHLSSLSSFLCLFCFGASPSSSSFFLHTTCLVSWKYHSNLSDQKSIDREIYLFTTYQMRDKPKRYSDLLVREEGTPSTRPSSDELVAKRAIGVVCRGLLLSRVCLRLRWLGVRTIHYQKKNTGLAPHSAI